jgi:hypothetical protein
MKFYNREIESWFTGENISFFRENNEDHGIIQFYTLLFDKTHNSVYIDQFPTIQSIFESEYVIRDSGGRTGLPDSERKKVLFYIDFLKSEGYLEVVPRLTVQNEKIRCVDHLIINNGQGNKALDISDLLKQSVNESTGHARGLILNNYTVDEGKLAGSISAKNPGYILYFPYYFLMEQFRTVIDPHSDPGGGRYRTLRRDKQIFLNSVYHALIEKDVLTYDRSHEHLKKLHGFFHFAWPKVDRLIDTFINHYSVIFRTLVEDFLMNESSHFSCTSLGNEHLDECIEEIKKHREKVSLDQIYDIVKTMLSLQQKILLSHSKEVELNPEVKFLRNLLVELILHDKTVLKFKSYSATGIKRKPGEDEKLPDSGEAFLPYISAHYRERGGDLVVKKAERLEDMKELLDNPANYNALFNRSHIFEEAVFSFGELLKQYKKYRKHYNTLFPGLLEYGDEKEQLQVLLNSFQSVSLIVRIRLPSFDCKETGRDPDWYAEAFFWNDRVQKQRAIDHHKKEYRYSRNKHLKNIHEEWLHCLPLSVKGANSRASKNEMQRTLLKARKGES